MKRNQKPVVSKNTSAGYVSPFTTFRFDFNVLLVWLLVLPAALPLLQPNTLTHSADSLLHLYRLVALSHALYQGAIFPRWLPDLAYGYGLPLFVFYAPLAYYLTLTLKLLGLGLVNALNVSLMLALLLTGTGVYLFTRDRFGSLAGILAGVAYAYAPIQLLNAFFRGSLPAVWAMAVFPFVFWIFGRLIRPSVTRPRRRLLLVPVCALLLALALLLHNVSNLLFVPFLGLYLGLELIFQFIDYKNREANSGLTQSKLWTPLFGIFFRQVIWPVGLAGVLGVGLAAFFLIPAVLEKGLIQVQRVIISPDFDFRFHFVHLPELLAWPQPANTGLLNPRYPVIFGLAQAGLAGVGLVGLRRLREPQPWAAAGLAMAGLAGAVFMMLPISLEVWERLPWLAFMQYPHRLLGPAAFLLAILAGLAVVAFPKQFRLGVTVAGILLIFLTTLPLLYPRYHHSFAAEPTLLDMMAYEHVSGAIGATSFGEYLPRWVAQVPAESPLEPLYQAGMTIERLDAAYLPPAAKIERADYGFNQVELVINSPEPYQAIFHTFYFPGWQARVDGQPANLAPVSERGLLGVVMPPGRHHLRLFFGETPRRRIADVISLVSLAIVGVLLGVGLRTRMNISFCVEMSHSERSEESPSTRRGFFDLLRSVQNDMRKAISLRTLKGFEPGLLIHPDNLSSHQWITLLGLAVLLILGKTLYVDRFDNPFRHTFDGITVAGANVTRAVNFGQQVNLLGYDLNRPTLTPGQSFVLTVYWQARQPLTTNYSSLAQLVDAHNRLYAAQDNLHPGEMPAREWPPWGFVQDSHRVRVPPGAPPGDYFLITGLYNPSTWSRLPVLSGGDPGWADVLALPVTVGKAPRPATIAELDILWPVATVAKTSKDLPIRLLGATPEREVIRRNDFLRVALFWEAVTAPRVDYRISLRLRDDEGRVILAETAPSSLQRYPTTRWTAGERVRDNHAVWIGQDFPAGTYHLEAQVLNEAGEAVSDWLELGLMSTAEEP
ncbi:MAG: hypothetical protein JXM69_01035 [Anaerolineae bacterium]|nr:hypothetical protein [Anaerolineae bacterium]